MKELIFQISKNLANELSVEQIIINMLAALIIGLVIYISYRFSHTGAVYSAKFNVSLLMLTLVTTLVMNVIGNNISLSLGMVGALSIVRFRTAIKDSRDTAYIFWCIAVGICCGVSYFVLAGISSGIIFIVMLIMGNVRANDRYLLIIHGNEHLDTKAIENTINQRFSGKAILRVQNRTEGHIEYIYELSARMMEADKAKSETIMDLISAENGVARVNLVCQNEEMSR